MLSITDIQIPYSRKNRLPKFSFVLEKPSLLFITGANGIGKSTFLKQLSGLYFSSSIQLNEKPIHNYSLKERASLIGMLDQSHVITFPVVVKDLIVMGRYVQQAALVTYSAEDYKYALKALQELGVDYLYEKNFLNLSGGEQQLCLLAQLSVQNPEFILLDEPTQNLDLYNKEKVFEWMSIQVYKKGKTVVCITHDLHWISGMQGYILHLNDIQITLQELSENSVLKTIELLKKTPF